MNILANPSLKRLTFDSSRRILSKLHPFIECHRGYNKLEPENTLAAFQKAIEHGYDSVELDVWLTLDHIPVVIHGQTNGEVNETTTGSGKVNNLSFSQVSEFKTKLKSDESVPTLEDVFILCKERIFLNIEIKDKNFKVCIDKVMELIQKYQMKNQVAISSFEHEYYDEIKKLNHEGIIEFGFLYDTTEGQKCDFVIKEELGRSSINLWYKEITQELVIKAHSCNIAVHCWFCMDDEETDELLTYLMNCGVDVICTNHPERAVKIRQTLFEKVN